MHQLPGPTRGFDRINALLAGLVFSISFIVYALTVQPTFSFWDCGEFIACSQILGIPHPPGTPLFILLGRIFAMIPFVEDIAHRVNYMSVLGSAFTAMLSYLLTVKLVRYFFEDHGADKMNRWIAYVGGLAGGFFVAFGATNWANSVETEVYGPGLAMAVMLVWLSVRYYETQGTPSATRTLILVMYIAMLGIGLHMTVFVVVPVCALFFLLKGNASRQDWLLVCGFAIAGLVLVSILSSIVPEPYYAVQNGREVQINPPVSAYGLYLMLLGTLLVGLVFMLYKKINWGIAIAIGTVGSVMVGFEKYLEFMAPLTLVYAIIPGAHFSWDVFTIKTLIYWTIVIGGVYLAIKHERQGRHFKWREGLAIVVLGFIGFSVHLYLPIQSQHAPRIDENNPSRDWDSFVNMLDRKQYGQTSMTERMFIRRGAFENQFGRHPNMGFWSYFEGQYSQGGWTFVPFLALGLLGMIVAIRKRLELGLPFFVLMLVVSVGLILYMNFADGTQYNVRSGDAYLEVRNRDYFFTPAFIFFGIAMGMGVSALIQLVRNSVSGSLPGMQKGVVYAGSLLVLLPGVSFAHNYHESDRSRNHIPRNYAANILDSCEPNAILFTSGDNDTFPVWCLQEVYNYRKDVRVVNLSLLNTDWYVAHMKNVMGVPISLTDEQIFWHPYQTSRGQSGQRPLKQFNDRSRRQRAYLEPRLYNNRVLKVQDMMVDEIVLENKWQNPIYFSSPPYAESPLKLRERTTLVGLVYRLERELGPPPVDVDRGYELFMNKYTFAGYESSEVFRDDNATGVFLGVGLSAVRIYDELMRQGDTTRGLALIDRMIDVYPEYWQFYLQLSVHLDAAGDSTGSDSLFTKLHDTLTGLWASNEGNLFYKMDLGLIKAEMGRRNNDSELLNDGLDLMNEAFESNPNSGYAFRKLVTTLNQHNRFTDMQKAATLFTKYGVNRNDQIAARILGAAPR